MRRAKWTIQEQAYFLKRTGELLARGYPLAEAIHSITYHLRPNKKNDIIQCLEELKEGFPFYKVLINLDFNHTIIGYVYFAEQHGGLVHAFQDGSEMILKRERDIQKLKKILSYPLFLIFLTIFLFVFVENILLPRFTSLFKSMNLSTNFFTKLVYFFGDVIPAFLFVGIFGVFAAFLYYLLHFRKFTPVKQKSILISLPLIGSFYRLLYTHYFSVQLSYLLGGGLSIIDALSLFEKKRKAAYR